jgi:hypothetical protein
MNRKRFHANPILDNLPVHRTFPAMQELILFVSIGNGKFGAAAFCAMMGEMVVAQMRWLVR